MANKKFSEFELKTTTSNVSHIVGYNGAENVRITPANFLDTTGGPYLPLAGGIMVGNTTHNDNVKSIYGTLGDGLEIYHNGTNSYIDDSGTGNLILRSSDLRIEKYTGEEIAKFVSDGAVSLYYDNSKKFETTNTGILVDGQANITSDDTTFISQLLDNTNTTDSGTESTEIKFRLYRSYVPGLNDAGNIVLGKEEAWDGAEDRKSYMAFGTRNGSAGVLEKLRISSAGNVGIGTSTPVARLQVKDSSDSGFDRGIAITRSASSQTGYINMVGGAMNFNSPVIPFTFRQSGSEKMRLDASGRLGIGTSNPSRDGLNVFHTTTPYVHLTNTTTGDTSSDGGYLALAGTELRLGNQEASGDLNMFVDNDSTVGMIIKSGGNVGVGTSTPSAKLHIQTEAAPTDIYLTDGTLGTDNYGGVIRGFSVAGQGGRLQLGTLDNDVYYPTLTILQQGGNVGVGTSTPDTLFQATNTVAAPDFISYEIGNTAVSGNNRGGFAIYELGVQQATISYYRDGSGRIELASQGESNPMTFATRPLGGVVTERMRITSGGNILANKTATGQVLTDGFEFSTDNYLSICNSVSANYSLYVANKGTSGTRNMVAFFGTSSVVGSITYNGTVTAFNTTSDYRLKEDLKDFKGLDLVSKIPVYDFKWKSEESRSYGVMAHELAEVLPDAVTGDKDAEENQMVDYSKIVPLLVKSIQELSAKLEALECQCEKK
jgi:hypothetical protein